MATNYSDDMTGSFDTNDINQNKGVSVVAYIPILFLIPLLAAGNSPFAKFHTNQGIILTITSVACGVVQFIVGLLLGWIPVVGAIISGLVGLVLGLGMLALILYGIISTAQGNAKRLPIIGGLMEVVK